MAGFELDEAADDVSASTSYLTSDQNFEIYEAIKMILEKYQGKGVNFYLAWHSGIHV